MLMSRWFAFNLLAWPLLLLPLSTSATQEETLETCLDEDRDLRLRFAACEAAATDVQAVYTLGRLYETGGESMAKNPHQAASWYGRAAEEGHAQAQFRLGRMYESGNHPDGQDFVRSVKWYSRSAAQGDAKAQLHLALAYAKGEGVQQDQRRAEVWLRRSASGGGPNERYNVGRAFEEGTGAVRRNSTEALMWYIISANDEVEPAKDSRDRLLAMLNSNRVAVAQKLADDWVRAHY